MKRNLTTIATMFALMFLGLSATTNACNPFTPTITGNPIYCTGFGPATLDAGVYSHYIWSSGDTTESVMLYAGAYSVTVTNSNGCTGIGSVTVIEDWGPTSTLIGNLTSANVEQGDSIEIYAYGFPNNSTLVWGDATTRDTDMVQANWISMIQYPLTVTDSNLCQFQTNIQLNVSEYNPYFTLYPDTNIPHHYFIKCAFIGIPPYTYDWNWGDSSPDDTTAAPTHYYANPGYYTICQSGVDSWPTSGYYCDSNYHVTRTSNYIYYITVINNMITTGVNEIKSNTISVYPNPVSNTLNIQYTNSPVQYGTQLSIEDVLGNKIYQQNITGINTTIDVSKWGEGVYFYEIIGGNEVSRGKFIVN
jgi:hypothetical protein